MTFKELSEAISKMPADKQALNATVFVKAVDEYYPIESIEEADPQFCDTLDEGHPFLMV